MKVRRNWLPVIAVVCCLTCVGPALSSDASDISGRWAVQWEVLHNYQYWIWTWYYPTDDISEDENIDDDLGKRGPIQFFVTQSGEKIEGSYLGFDRCGETIVRYYFTGTISDDNKVYFSIVVPALSYFCGSDFHLHTEDIVSFEGIYNDVDKVITGTWEENQQGSYWLHREYYPEYLCFDVVFLDLFWCGNFTITISPNMEVAFLDKRPPYSQVIGATADGSTEVAIKISPLPRGTSIDDVQITILSDDGDENGYLRDDKHIASGVFTQTYVAPDKFPGDIGESKRYVNFLITVKGETLDVPSFALVRPPVVMMHGIWSNAGAFASLNRELYKKGFMYLYRPSYNNSASFSTNDWVLPHLINNILTNLRTEGGLACTKIDIVVHSMGGLLAKRLEPSFAQKTVRKIITIGTPYSGSPLADLLWAALADDPFRTFFLEENLNDLFHTTKSISGGAIKDLRCYNNPNIPISTKIQGVDCRNVIVGLRDGTLWDLTLDAYVIGLMLLTRQWSPEAVHDFIFGSTANSDWVVPEDSQQYRADTYQVIPVHWHCSETQDADFKNIVIEALNQPAQISKTTSSGFELHELTSMPPRQIYVAPKKVSLISSESNGTVDIIEPKEGQSCIAGQSIKVSVQGSGDTIYAALFAFWGSSAWADIVELPWTGDINVPPDAVGSAIKIIALGVDANMNMTDDAKVKLVLESNIWLEEIFFGFGDKWYFDFKTDPCQPHQLQLYPLGRFSDGSEYPLSILAEQTIYTSLNESVATIDCNGLVTIHSPGGSVITVSNSEKTAILQIEVDTYTGDLNLDGVVNFLDIAVFANHWRDLLCSYTGLCDGTDLNMTTDVTAADLAILCSHWLEGAITASPE